jgi:DNA-directed RNA polymerase specialized sigma24 family protein
MRKTTHYVNNKTLFETMKTYKESYDKSKENNEELPRIPEYVGESIMLICNRLSYKYNFINYTYKEEMIGDGIENCLAAINNFKPDRSNNPFAYFTQIAYNAFIRRITKEKKQTYIKHKNMENMFLFNDLLHEFGHDENNNIYAGNNKNNHVVEDFEKKLAESKKKNAIISEPNTITIISEE